MFLIGYSNLYSQSDSLLFAKTDSLYESNQGEEAIQLVKINQTQAEREKKWVTYINCFNKISRYLEASEDINERIHFNEKAIAEGIKHLGPEHKLIGEAYQQKGEILIALNQSDSAVFYLDKAILLFAKNQDQESLCWALIVKAIAFYYQNEFPEMERYLLEALTIVEANPELNQDIPNTIFQTLSVNYTETGDFEKSLHAAQSAINISLLNPNPNYVDSALLAERYNNLGIIYSKKNDFEQAIQNYKIALRLSLKLSSSNETLINYYNNIGQDLKLSGEYEKAQQYFLNSIQKLDKGALSSNYTKAIDTYLLLGDNYLEMGDIKNSFLCLNKISSIILKSKYDEEWYYFSLGKVYSKNEDYQKAIANFIKAQNIFHQKLGTNHEYYGKSLFYLGETYTKIDSFHTSLKYLQKALISIKPDFNPTSHFSNPNLKNFSAYSLLLPILKTKTEVLRKLHANDISALEKILPTYQLASETIDKIRQDQVSQESKLILSSNARDIYDGAISLLFQLYQSSGNSDYLDQAFRYMEKSKSLILLEGIKEYKTLQTSIQPLLTKDSLFQKLLKQEKQLKLDHAFYEKKLSEAKQDKDSLKTSTIEEILVDVYQSQQNLQRKFEQEYPAYFQINFNQEVATIGQVQNQLLLDNPSQALLEYYLGEEAIYLIRLIGKDKAFYRLDYPDNFHQLIQTYRHALADKKSFGSEHEQFVAFTQSSHQIYQSILAPILGDLPADIQQLHLITDGTLGYISFESLLTSKINANEINYSINHLDYLLEKYIINYGYSSTLLLENNQPQNQEKNLKPYAGFAPVYDQNEMVAERSCESGQPLGALLNTETSVKRLQSLLGGNLFLREQANKNNFLEKAADYQILHLSTHACVDDQNPLFNRIFFAHDYLPTYEVYNLHLNADLVVLSACETGFGKLVKGEGIMSLARSFMYAGSQSVVTSLWNANDYATTEIMIAFHGYLKEGLSKAKALHKAKLDYLKKAPSRISSPYYWSNFILIGNADSIEFESYSNIDVLLLIMILFILGFFSVKILKLNKNTAATHS